MTSARELLDIAQLLATEGGKIAIEGQRQATVAATKSSAIDIVTQMDIEVERVLRERIAELRPDDAILGEEGDDVEGTSGVTWVLDPIDGTVNYLYGLPHFSVSVAAVTGDPHPHRWTQQAGAVYDGAGVLWTAARGEGAWRDGEKLFRAEAPDLSGTLLATGFQYISERRVRQGEIVTSLLGKVRDIRRLGSSTIDMCAAAAGLIDAYYEHGLQPWDMGAASLIASEAGLKVGGLDHGPADSRLLITAHPDRYDALYEALYEAGADRTWDTPSA